MGARNLSAELDATTEETFLEWYEAWKERVRSNAIARMRFAGLRFIVRCRRHPNFNPRRTMGFDEVRL